MSYVYSPLSTLSLISSSDIVFLVSLGSDTISINCFIGPRLYKTANKSQKEIPIKIARVVQSGIKTPMEAPINNPMYKTVKFLILIDVDLKYL